MEHIRCFCLPPTNKHRSQFSKLEYYYYLRQGCETHVAGPRNPTVTASVTESAPSNKHISHNVVKLQRSYEIQNKTVKGIRGAQYPGQAQVLLI